MHAVSVVHELSFVSLFSSPPRHCSFRHHTVQALGLSTDFEDTVVEQKKREAEEEREREEEERGKKGRPQHRKWGKRANRGN